MNTNLRFRDYSFAVVAGGNEQSASVKGDSFSVVSISDPTVNIFAEFEKEGSIVGRFPLVKGASGKTPSAYDRVRLFTDSVVTVGVVVMLGSGEFELPQTGQVEVTNFPETGGAVQRAQLIAHKPFFLRTSNVDTGGSHIHTLGVDDFPILAGHTHRRHMHFRHLIIPRNDNRLKLYIEIGREALVTGGDDYSDSLWFGVKGTFNAFGNSGATYGVAKTDKSEPVDDVWAYTASSNEASIEDEHTGGISLAVGERFEIAVTEESYMYNGSSSQTLVRISELVAL